MTAPLIARVLLDAQSEFARAIEHVPGPGRGGRLGVLNSAGWAIAHATATHDAWINVYCGGAEHDPWCERWSAQRRASPDSPLPTRFDEAAEAFARVAERATGYLERCGEADLATVAGALDGSAWRGRTKGYLVARGVAHLFAHAGELSVIASLVRSEDRDLGLPGPLSRSTGTGSEALEPAGEPPVVVRLLLDARGQFARVADAAPAPAQAGAFDRLNAGGWIVAHLAEQDDQYWGVHAQGLTPDQWLASADVKFGDAASSPDYVEARAALDRSFERSRSYLEGLDGSDFDRVLRRSRGAFGDQTQSDLVVRQLTHLFALAGELGAIASLAGADDPGLPGRLSHVAGS